MGNLLVNSLSTELGLSAEFLHGGLSRTKRDKMVDAFQNDPRSQILILSLKAGGTGLNLTVASGETWITELSDQDIRGLVSL